MRERRGRARGDRRQEPLTAWPRSSRRRDRRRLASTSRTASTTRRTTSRRGSARGRSRPPRGARSPRARTSPARSSRPRSRRRSARGSSTPASRPRQTFLAALLGAIAWNLFTWWLGLPSSSTHALIGGLVGAALVQSGSSGVQWHGIWRRCRFPALVSPVIGFVGAFVLLVAHLPDLLPGAAGRRRTAASGSGSSSRGTWVAFTHGANDAQKTMGVIALALLHARAHLARSRSRPG